VAEPDKRPSIAPEAPKGSRRGSKRRVQVLCGLCAQEATEDASNWAEVGKDELGRAEPQGQWCKDCAAFFKSSSLDATEANRLLKLPGQR
jgi:hypothetical protein